MQAQRFYFAGSGSSANPVPGHADRRIQINIRPGISSGPDRCSIQPNSPQAGDSIFLGIQVFKIVDNHERDLELQRIIEIADVQAGLLL